MKAIEISAGRGNNALFEELLREQYRLRARVFKDRLGWAVTVTDGAEVDVFDLLYPTYILTLLDDGTVAGCARLLPVIGPTMLQEVFPLLLPASGFQTHIAMIESSRFCVDTQLAHGQRSGIVHEVTLTMFSAILEWCVCHQYSEIVTVTDLRFERILSRVGWPLQRISEPKQIGVTVAVAGVLPANCEIFARLKPSSYASDISLAQPAA
jgi:N-acyl-L-homoserine lactone synthetase